MNYGLSFINLIIYHLFYCQESNYDDMESGRDPSVLIGFQQKKNNIPRSGAISFFIAKPVYFSCDVHRKAQGGE